MMESPPNPQGRMDSEHLKLLSVFHYVVGSMAAFFACIPIIHLVIGVVLITDPQAFGPRNNPPPPFLGGLLIALAAGFILAGWTLAVLVLLAGRFIARRRHYTFCFVMACIECVFMPFGTVLGAFTIIVLLRPSVKELFTPTPTI
jgi:hypothetical protein